MKHHYVYHLTLWRGTSYIGVRTSKCLPENDSYYGSSREFDGSDVMSKTIIKTFTKRTTANNYEAWLHQCYDVANNKAFENIMIATLGGFYYGQPHTPEVKKKMSESQIEWNKNNPNNFKGRKHSEKTKQAWSKSRTGVRRTEEAVAIITKSFKIKTIYKVINNNTNEVYYGLYNDFRVNSKTVFNRGKTFVHKLMRRDLGVQRSGWTAIIFIERKGPKSRM